MHINTPKDLAAYCKYQRKKQKLTQTQLGKKVGLRQSTVSAFESYPDASKISTLFRLLSAANLELQIKPKTDSLTSEHWQEEW